MPLDQNGVAMHCAAQKALRFLSFICVGILLLVPVALADTINLGFVSFDGFIGGSSGSPGVNEFSINNFTGDPGLGGSALAPDFPAFTFVTFQNAQLTLDETSGPEVFNLGDLSAGTALSDLITASTDILSATFTATLDHTVLSVGGGGTFTAASADVQAVLSPSSPPFLSTGDFALITASGSQSTIPEPSTGCLLLVIAAPLAFLHIKKRL